MDWKKIKHGIWLGHWHVQRLMSTGIILVSGLGFIWQFMLMGADDTSDPSITAKRMGMMLSFLLIGFIGFVMHTHVMRKRWPKYPDKGLPPKDDDDDHEPPNITPNGTT